MKTIVFRNNCSTHVHLLLALSCIGKKGNSFPCDLHQQPEDSKWNYFLPTVLKGGKFLKKLWCCVGGLRRRANARNVSFRISLRWPIHIINPVDKTKLSMFCLYVGGLRRRANARNVSFRISLRWPIHIINPVDKTKLSMFCLYESLLRSSNSFR